MCRCTALVSRHSRVTSTEVCIFWTLMAQKVAFWMGPDWGSCDQPHVSWILKRKKFFFKNLSVVGSLSTGPFIHLPQRNKVNCTLNVNKDKVDKSSAAAPLTERTQVRRSPLLQCLLCQSDTKYRHSHAESWQLQCECDIYRFQGLHRNTGKSQDLNYCFERNAHGRDFEQT